MHKFYAYASSFIITNSYQAIQIQFDFKPTEHH